MRICVSLQMYVFLMHFILFFSSIFLFVMSYPGWLVSFYLLILSSFYFLCGCLYSNEIKKENVWIWVGGEAGRIWKELGDGKL